VFERETLPDGSILLRAARCRFTFRRPRSGVLLVVIEGYDDGIFGDAPFDHVLADIARFGTIELFVDTTQALGAVTPVREAWTTWFAAQKPRLRRVHLAGASKFMLSALHITKELSRTGDLIQVYSDHAAFTAALARAGTGSSG
jgi:hypothetical protein